MVSIKSIGVLIETSWNVKMDEEMLLIEQIRINRNIVECKDRMREMIKSLRWY